MTLPPLCRHHAGVYATRTNALRRRFRYPGAGRKALAREAESVARQCPRCIEETTP